MDGEVVKEVLASDSFWGFLKEAPVVNIILFIIIISIAVFYRYYIKKQNNNLSTVDQLISSLSKESEMNQQQVTELIKIITEFNTNMAKIDKLIDKTSKDHDQLAQMRIDLSKISLNLDYCCRGCPGYLLKNKSATHTNLSTDMEGGESE